MVEACCVVGEQRSLLYSITRALSISELLYLVLHIRLCLSFNRKITAPVRKLPACAAQLHSRVTKAEDEAGVKDCSFPAFLRGESWTLKLHSQRGREVRHGWPEVSVCPGAAVVFPSVARTPPGPASPGCPRHGLLRPLGGLTSRRDPAFSWDAAPRFTPATPCQPPVFTQPSRWVRDRTDTGVSTACVASEPHRRLSRGRKCFLILLLRYLESCSAKQCPRPTLPLLLSPPGGFSVFLPF